jgi:hypothetical protein
MYKLRWESNLMYFQWRRNGQSLTDDDVHIPSHGRWRPASNTLRVMFNQFRVVDHGGSSGYGVRGIWFSQQIANCPRNVLQPQNSEWICHLFAEKVACITNISDHLAISSRNNSLCIRSRSFNTHITTHVSCHWTVYKQTNSVSCVQANYNDRATTTCRWS